MKGDTIGFIGFGEAAYGITKGLKAAGFAEVLFYDKLWDQQPAGALIEKRAQETGAILKQSIRELLQETDLVISCASAAVAVIVAQGTLPYLEERHVYIDVNATSPMVKEDIAALVQETGASFVDAAMMGPIPTFLQRVPILASGAGAEYFRDQMVPYGMDITCIGDKPGRASAIKMFRSIFMKGYVALLLETLEATHRYQASDLVLESISQTMEKNPFLETVRLLVTRGVIHAERRAHEMEEVIKTLEGIGIIPTMSTATLEKLRACAQLDLKGYFQGEAPATVDEVLQAIDLKTGQ